ncbi:DUF4365 domain-containing protein [Herbiconiux sp. VKM Ac-2851]|nr:DUF4365 domain-containing protein [Herbiconiux sp. VKM Ac-2851]
MTTMPPTIPPGVAQPFKLGTTSVDANFTDNGRKARYALAYFRSICAQAGVSVAETEPDEDIMAIDVAVHFPRLSARVQIKCTSKFKLTGKSVTMDLDPKWVESWKESFAPVYFLVVIVPAVIPDWIVHPATSTSHKTGAYWVRFDPTIHREKITVLKTSRFTLDTLHEWKSDVDATLGIGSEP